MRPIDADALLEGIEELKRSPWYNGENGNYESLIRSDAIGIVVDLCIKSAPTIDSVPVKRGKWMPWYKEDKNHKTGFSRGLTQLGWWCSACHWRSGSRTKFCPNCGARMDGGVKHE